MKPSGLFVLACCLGPLAGDGVGQPAGPQLARHAALKHLRHHHENHWGPYFEHDDGDDPDGTRNASSAVAAQLGAAARLDCRVAMLRDKTVTWLRRWPDRVRLLTVGLMTYSSDPRLQVGYQYPNNWRLLISPVRREDEGSYLCQVSTHPPRARTTYLTVLAPDMRLVDEQGRAVKDRYYKTGSSIELTCLVVGGEVDPGLRPAWLKDGQPLSPQLVSPRRQPPGAPVASQLVIRDARKSHSGAYSCALSEHVYVVANVYVLNGETQAAVQQDSWDSGGAVLPPGGHLTQLLVLTHAVLFAEACQL